MIVPETRRLARELALQVLFQQEFSPKLDFEKGLQTFRGNFHAPEEVWSYALKLLAGLKENKESIDQLISANSSHWTLDRMALVDLNILRIATFELIHLASEIPPKTAINEAIEISKKYGTSESSSFVNGILDQIKSLDSRV